MTIITRKFLLVLSICMPMTTMAAEETSVAQYKDIDKAVKGISEATSISDAATKYEAEFNKLANYYSKVVESGTISTERQKMQKLINDALNSGANTSSNAVSESNSGTNVNFDTQRVAEAKKKYQDAKAKEQSLANRTLTAGSIAATGIGGMELAMGMAEQSADKNAANSMAAYIATMRCTYADGKQVKAGPDEIELPGGNNQQLMNLRAEYFALANDLKERKSALGMQPGIESTEILDKAATGLYDDEMVGITSSAYESLYRAQMLGSETDQAKIDEAATASKRRVMGGAIAAGVGVVGGVLGNSLINGKLGELIKKNKAKRNAKSINAIDSNATIIGLSEAALQKYENLYPNN